MPVDNSIVEPVLFTLVLSAFIQALQPLIREGKLRIFEYKRGLVLATLAPDFKVKGTFRDAVMASKWKISGWFDVHPTSGDVNYLFCQGDPLKMDNWSETEVFKLGVVFEKAYPNFKSTLVAHLPIEKAYLVEELYEQNCTTCEIAFALKELIAYAHILECSEENIKTIFAAVTVKDKPNPYSDDYKTGIVAFLENFINVLKNDPMPKKLKFDLGRNAAAYALIAFNKEFKSVLDSMGFVVNLEDELLRVLKCIKTHVVMENSFLKSVWDLIRQFNVKIGEISSDDKIWARKFLPKELEKPETTNVSVLGWILMLLSGITDSDAVMTWDVVPFSGDVNTVILDKLNTEPSVIDFMDKNMNAGQNRLGTLCQDICSTMYTA